MADFDQLLHAYLEELEAGTSLEEITAGFTEEEAEIIPLLTLAVSLREIPHPEISPAAVQSQRAKVMALTEKLVEKPAKRTLFPRSRWITPGLAAALVLVLLALVTIFSSVFFFGRTGRDVVALVELAGLVEVAQAGELSRWSAAVLGDKLQEGDRIRTGDSGGAQLVYPDGSTTTVGPLTELVLNKAAFSERSGRQVSLFLERGETTHKVEIDLREAGEFVVQTPNGSAYVQGTWFDVRVDRLGISRFSVVDGEILVDGSEQRVTLSAGQTTTVSPGNAPSPPAYLFSGQGMVAEVAGTTWWIGGLPVTVIDQTSLVGDPGEGDFVAVLGRVLEGDLWLADQVEVIMEGRSFFQFAGPVEVIGEFNWQIAGVVVVLDDESMIDESLVPGQLAKVTFIVLPDGDRLALVIESLGGEPGDDLGNLVFVPNLLRGQGCAIKYSFEANLVNTGEGMVSGVNVISVPVRGEEYIISLAVNPAEIESIPIGDEIGIITTVSLSPEWLNPPAGAEIEIWVYAVDDLSTADEDVPGLRLVIPARCATPTPTPTATPTPTPSPTPEPPPLPGDGKVTICHIPPGNPDNAHTLSIGSSAVPAHLGHGDTLGPCP